MQSKYLPEIAVRVDLTVEGVMTTSYKYWVGPSHHSPNDMTPLSIDINVHDPETLIIGCPMDQLRGYQGPGCLHTIRALMFSLNTVIAWYKTYYEQLRYDK